jgi:hypothetical protein
VTRALTMFQHGLVWFAICKRCHSRIESRFLYLLKATEEIRDKYETHKCRSVEHTHASAELPKSRASARDTMLSLTAFPNAV